MGGRQGTQHTGMTQTNKITAVVHPGLLEKADRLFTNDDESVFVELIQNARRAGATCIEVAVEENESEQGCTVTIRDNGEGIADFQDLLTLGGSGWSNDTQAKEDPAGMGFFSLCRSEVEVTSRQQRAKITPAVFSGKAVAEVQQTAEFVAGTRIVFTRTSGKEALTSALNRATEFCPITVSLAGCPLPQHDFLEGALYREMIDGIEVGFATSFTNAYHSYGDANWNFYGARLKHTLESVSGYLPPGTLCPASLHIRCNVFETGKVKLQLPDRRAIIEDEFFVEFQRKARAALYRFLETQPHHILPFHNWQEARELGVILPEAAFLLTTWHAEPSDDGVDRLFGYPEQKLLSDVTSVVLVSANVDDPFTLEGALQSGAVIEGNLYQENRSFKGYNWYDKLARIVGTVVLFDGVQGYDWSKPDNDRPKTIEIDALVEQRGMAVRRLRLPTSLHVDGDEELRFVAVKNSPWDNDKLEGPFSIADFLVMATFRSSEDVEADSWQTQKEYWDEVVERAVNGYFRGPRATLLAMLHKAIEWEPERLCDDLGIVAIHFKRNGRTWDVELITATDSSEDVSRP